MQPKFLAALLLATLVDVHLAAAADPTETIAQSEHDEFITRE